MNPIIRNILAVIAGIVVSMAVNMLIVVIGSSIFPTLEGVDTSDIESIKANSHLYTPKYWIGPLVAHGLGSLVGAFVAAIIAKSHRLTLALVVGAVHMLGGIMMCALLDFKPIGFTLCDLGLAYIPAAWLGWKIAVRTSSHEPKTETLIDDVL